MLSFDEIGKALTANMSKGLCPEARCLAEDLLATMTAPSPEAIAVIMAMMGDSSADALVDTIISASGATSLEEFDRTATTLPLKVANDMGVFGERTKDAMRKHILRRLEAAAIKIGDVDVPVRVNGDPK